MNYLQDANVNKPVTYTTKKALTVREKILTTSALYLKVEAPPRATCNSRRQAPTVHSAATATTPLR